MLPVHNDQVPAAYGMAALGGLIKENITQACCRVEMAVLLLRNLALAMRAACAAPSARRF